MLKTKLLGATAAAEPVFIEDVFSTYLYTGNGSTQTITNGIDLAGEGGMVWLKSRSAATNNYVYDTERGVGQRLITNATVSQFNATDSLTAFNSDGFSLGADTIAGQVNISGTTYASWTFRKAERFFDVVTYTGNGVAGRTVSHNLGTTVGSIFVKRTDTTSDWVVYHRGLNPSTPEYDYIILNSTASFNSATSRWNDTQPTDSVFTLGNSVTVNASGGTYVAYLFAHDPLGPSGDGSDGLIACGSYTGTGAEQSINLGWEPQWLLVKRSNSTGSWYIVDNMRGSVYSDTNPLFPNTSDAEDAGFPANRFNVNATGFSVNGSSPFNEAGSTYIYIAIRRGPMREPTSGTEVFAPVLGDATPPAFNTTFPVDLNVYKWRTSGTAGSIWSDRLRGATSLNSSNTNAEFGNGLAEFDYMDGFGDSTGFTTAYIGWNFRRAPGFFDVVAYSGTGSAKTNNHNLGVIPELMIIKNRSAAASWAVFHTVTASGYKLQFLNNTDAQLSYTYPGALVSQPTATSFEVGGIGTVGDSGNNYIAYLFATLPGVSKVGSYTGNGSNQTINCGFTGGARFVLIKRTDSTGDWYVWDTARGIVAGNDPHLSLNTMAAEVTTNDSIDPDSSGFIVNQVTATNINVSSASYIYLAIA